ncbi:hypothetical protein ABPG75_008023 [Micractinium tetrahymenae]
MSSSEPPPGRILLLSGGSLVSAHSLLSAITHPSAPPPLSSGGSAHAWRLDNKYYTADVQFELRHVEQCEAVRLEDYEAVLLVFDAVHRPDSFTSLRRWWEAAGGADLGVRLAVGLAAAAAGGGSSLLGSPAWLAEAEEWCAEQLVEFVEVAAPTGPAEGEGAPGLASVAAAAAAAPPGGGAGSTGSGGEATGMDRIREALQAHMWPGMQLKPSPRRGAAAAEPASRQADEAAEVKHTVPLAANSVHLTNGAAASDSRGSATAGDTAGSAAAGEEEGLSFADFLRSPAEAAAAAASRGQQGAGGAAEPAAGAAVQADAQAEAEVEDLHCLFELIEGHRAGLAQLPDAQRREAAADIVMQLMAAMGLDEEEEEGA